MTAKPLLSAGVAPDATTPVQGADDNLFEVYDAQPAVWPHFLVGQKDRPVRVLLVDSDVHLLRVMSQELMVDPRTMVVAQASSVREARRTIKQHDFEVLLLDLNLEQGEGFVLLDYLKTVRPRAEAISVSDTDSVELALRAFALGAKGFLRRGSWFGNYPQAVLQVANGGAALDPLLARQLLLRFDARPAPEDPAALAPVPQPEQLTAHETEVLRLVAGGYSTAEIAQRLGTSSIAINTAVRSIYRKFQLRTRAQAVRFASLRGLL